MNKLWIWGLSTMVVLSAVAEESKSVSAYDTIWNMANLVEQEEATVLQRLSFSGRLQGDAFSFRDSDTANEDVLWRRLRLGFKAKVFKDFTLHSELDLNLNEAEQDSWDKFYRRLTDTYIGWKPSKAVNLKVGKQSAGFTLDGATSSKKLLVPERSIVAENLWFAVEYFTGAAVYGKVGDASYKIGGYSASGEPELGHFESGYFALLSAGHKVGEKGSIRLDYVYNAPDYTGTLKDPDYKVGTKNFDHVISLVYKQMLTKKLGIWSDLAWANGIQDASNPGQIINQGDLLGIDIMPFYNFTDRFQLVLQYAGVTSLDHQSQVRMSRYAYRNTGRDTVETAHNLLLGFNWYLYGHKLKWQNAVEYNYGKNLATSGGDYNGYGVTSAFRLSW